MRDEEVARLENDTGLRVLVLAIEEDGSVSMDDGGFAGWEIVGLAHWLEVVGEEMTEQEMHGDDS